jgi:ubiquinone/menaquinone biosynthesis C-methylase UbiE
MAQQSEKLAGAPLGGRQPTSHEQMTGRPWDASYQGEGAPWDIGRPQAAFVRAAGNGGFAGAVLDAGCGSGEHALLAASLGLPVLGVDVAETALAMARKKAAERGLDAEFAVADALHLERSGRRFQTVLDCGLFHTFNGDERAEYVASLASVTEPRGTLYVLCFSDQGPEPGPHPVREAEVREAFNAGSGWEIASLERDHIQTRFQHMELPAWFITLRRV